MAAITLTEAQAQLQVWLEASKAIAGAQEYYVNGHRMRRADAAEVRKQINYWATLVTQLTNSANNMPTTSYSLASFK